jgi:7-keto-8-aminopelargonate synthetase-like enzyme
MLTAMQESFGEARRLGLMYQATEDAAFDGRHVTVAGRSLVHMGSCSYLGLELDERLVAGAVDAVRRYGSQFSASRVFLSSPLYAELEDLLGQVFEAPVIVAPTTSLAHVAAFPVLIAEDAAVILDQQAHSSIQNAANHLRVRGTHVEVLRHNRLDLLEERIVALRQRHREIWYMADGVYSIFGDHAPFEGLRRLLDRHEQLRLYVDDAHGMSWAGHFGRGLAAAHLGGHPRVVIVTSLAKAFGATGGVLVLPDDASRQRVRMVGSSMVFSGPIPPATLGAAVAAARLHLSSELPTLQAELRDMIDHCNAALLARQLPLVFPLTLPVRFLATGTPGAAHHLTHRLLEEGYFPNVAVFPAVPMKHAGVRFTVTRHHTRADLERFADAIARHLPEALAAGDTSLEAVLANFEEVPGALPTLRPRAPVRPEVVAARSASGLVLTHTTTIEALPQADWDAWLGDRGSFTWQGLRALEALFRDQPDPAATWRFHYYVVHDATGQPVLATFFTEALWKDDMIAPEGVSRAIEARRREEPGFLVSRTLAMGSQLTEGDHLWLDPAGPWEAALALVLGAVEAERARCRATSVVLRDLPGTEGGLARALREHGYVRFPMPESWVLALPEGGDEAWLASLGPRSRRALRREVLDREAAFGVQVFTSEAGPRPAPALASRWRWLYEQVKGRSLLINTFDLPTETFETLLAFPGWEVLSLTLDPAAGGPPDGQPVAVIASHVGPTQYAPMVIGMDYAYVATHGLYRQALLQCLRRARAHDKARVCLGIGAPQVKERFGAHHEPRDVWLRASDDHQQEVLVNLMLQQAPPPA